MSEGAAQQQHVADDPGENGGSPLILVFDGRLAMREDDVHGVDGC